MSGIWHRVIVPLAAALLAVAAHAADDPPAAPAGAPRAKAREQIAAKQWPQAVA
ncbi:MAG: hypothetical protein HXY24_17860, partial [Rubrivivax sp.]|nr:hypothetical protein [Rubrivivax sp.]